MRKQNRIMPHPVWVAPGAVNPRNQKLNRSTVQNTRATAHDMASRYVDKMHNPLLAKTANDVLNDIKEFYSAIEILKEIK